MNQRLATSVNPKPATTRVRGHFGELAQGLASPGGTVALVTLPCPALVTEVTFRPAPGPPTSGEPVSRKALDAARATLARLGRADWGGEILIRRACPPGLGAGTSTAEALGTVRAVAAAFGQQFSPDDEAALCLAAEGAVDPLMHECTTLFASRQGRVLRRLPPLPGLAVAGGFAGAARITDPADKDFPPMGDVFEAIEAALSDGDLRALGVAATRSAAANQTRNPNPAWEAVQEISRDVGALGVCVAHTGSAIALLLDPGNDPTVLLPRLSDAGLQHIIGWTL
ncbi:propanediol utilization protein [Limibaculum sp. M0105]|uniref:Propanediol utilization protein n=1 Tax=Thermohalobaculum xanthum TaxID=2753746 RepID=A0A8J7M3J2_9RHOB|nr:propanediol utilization protein [Thermohalobaculum xanthum]MBK0397656.1 propanediol utilization protein [Thermohalobaculum xanthum]